MKLMFAVLLVLGALGALVAASPSDASALPPDPWVGDWQAIHPSPLVPNAHMRIAGHHGHYAVVIRDAEDKLFCDGVGVIAVGAGSLTDATHMTVRFLFRCAGATAIGHQTVALHLNLNNPNHILEIADPSGHVWTRTP